MRKWIVLAGLLLCLAVPGERGRAETLRFGTAEADTQAEYIDMGDGEITDWEAFYQFLSCFPNLRKADLFATEIQAERIAEMTGRFPDIAFGMTMRIQEHTVRTDDTAFSTLHNPKSPHHDEAVFSVLRFCTHLYALDLGHNRIKDLGFLQELPELRVLILSMNTVTDLTPAGGLKHLEYLEIFNNSVSDISCLSDLAFLTDLNLVMNQIENMDCVREFPRLKRLWMSHYRKELPVRQILETAEGIRSALPECTVDALSTGTGGEWRTHPHYDVITRIFRTGRYEPFEDSPEENLPAEYRQIPETGAGK